MNLKLLVVFFLLLFSVSGASADKWVLNNSIISGLGDVGTSSTPNIYTDSGTFKLISGNFTGGFTGWDWNGTGWESNSSIVTVLGDLEFYSSPSIYNDAGTLKLISAEKTEFVGLFHGWQWNGTGWESNSSIVTGLGATGLKMHPSIYNDSGVMKLIYGDENGGFYGYYLSGSTWNSDSSIVTGLADVGWDSTPNIYNDSGAFKLISGEQTGVFNGWDWNGSSWVSNSSIISGLGDIGSESAPSVFDSGVDLKLLTGNSTGGFKGFDWNIKPTTPTVTLPVNNSLFLSHGLSLNVTSTDQDSDSLTYYFYGDTTDGTTLINISTTGNYTWNVEDYGLHYWKVRAYDGNEYSVNTSLQQFTLLAPPDLQTPTNASTHTYSFPPLLHDLTFNWQDINAPAYKYQVATDDDFNLITEEDTITSNTTTLSLEADDYYWRIYAYETSTGTYSNASDVWEFTINETNGDGAITAIDGVVYEVTAAGSVAVDGALVNVWNSTWSDSMLVGQNGYYYFDGAKDGTYSVRATKTGYTDSSIELVTVLALNTTTRNILLQSTSGAGQQYVDHYVKFIVKSLIGTLYSDVEVNVYLGDAVIPQYTGTTGTDGSISFELNEYQEYRITFEKPSPSIDREITIYPKDDSYTVYVDIGTMIDDLLNPDDEEQAITAIEVSVTKTIVNDNTANITVNYNDIMDETSGLTLTLSQSIAGNTTNKTILSTVDLGTANNTAYNFTVTNYNGESYLIEIEATHTTHGAIYRMYGIQFENTDTLFGFTVEVVGWLAIIFITWFALTATSVTVPHTAIGVCALATVMMAIGWGSYISVPGLGLAWIMTIGANMAHAKEASA